MADKDLFWSAGLTKLKVLYQYNRSKAEESKQGISRRGGGGGGVVGLATDGAMWPTYLLTENIDKLPRNTESWHTLALDVVNGCND